MSKSIYRLEISSHFCAFSLSINGIIQTTEKHQPEYGFASAINHFLLNERNLISVNIGVPLSKDIRPEEMNFQCKIIKYTGDESNIQSELLCELIWKLEEFVDFPLILQKEFFISEPNFKWQWQNANLVLDPLDVILEIKPLLNELFVGMESKNSSKVSEILSLKTHEMALAFNIPIQERQEDQNVFFRDIFESPNFEMRVISENLIAIKHAEGKIWELTDEFGECPIRTCALEDDTNFGIEIFASKIDGNWIIVR